MAIDFGEYSRPGALRCYSPDSVQWQAGTSHCSSSWHCLQLFQFRLLSSHTSASSFHLSFFHQIFLLLKRQPKNRGSCYKPIPGSSLLAYKQNQTLDNLSDSTCTCLVQERGDLGLIPFWGPVNTHKYQQGDPVTPALLEGDVRTCYRIEF